VGADVGAAADAGYALNLPLRRVQGGFAHPALLAVDHPAVRVEAVKLADDRSGDVAVRLSRFACALTVVPLCLRPALITPSLKSVSGQP
jgi:hypothetical protein